MDAKRVGLERVGTAARPSPRPLRTMDLPERILHSVVALPDGDTCVVSAENDGTLYVLSVGEGRVLRLLKGHESPVNSLALAAGGRLLLSASDDETIRAWETETWRVTAVFEGHSGHIRRVAGAGMVAVSGGEDRTVRVWDLETATCRGVFEDHRHSVDRVAISPDGRRAASASRDNHVLLWDLREPRLERELYDARQDVYDLPTTALLGEVFIALGGNDTGVGHDGAPTAMAFDRTGDRLYTAEGEVIRWDLRDVGEPVRFPPQRVIRSLAVHPELPRVAVASLHGIGITDPDGARLASLTMDASHGVDLAFLPDGRLVSIHDEHQDRAVRLWPSVAAAQGEGDRHAAQVSEVAVDPAARLAASADSDGGVMLWELPGGDVAAGMSVPDLKGVPAFTPSGHLLVVADLRRVHVLPTAGGDPRAVPAAEPEEFTHVTACVPIDDGSVLVVPYTSPPQVWSLDGDRRRPLRGAAGKAGPGTPVVSGTYALVPARLEKSHPIIEAAVAAGDTAADKIPVSGVPAVQCWDLAGGELAWTRHGPLTDEGRTWPCHSWARTLGDGSAVTLTGYGAEMSLLVLAVATGEVVREVPVPPGLGEPPVELADGTLLFVGRGDSGLELWELAPGASWPRRRMAMPGARTVRLAPDRDLLFRLQDQTLTAYGLGDGERLAAAELSAPGSCLAISPDGGTAVVGDQDGGVHIFRVT